MAAPLGWIRQIGSGWLDRPGPDQSGLYLDAAGDIFWGQIAQFRKFVLRQPGNSRALRFPSLSIPQPGNPPVGNSPVWQFASLCNVPVGQFASAAIPPRCILRRRLRACPAPKTGIRVTSVAQSPELQFPSEGGV